METEKQLNSKILKTTTTIAEEFPELSKYIEETPMDAAVTDSPEMAIRNLKEYNNSLENLLHKYATDHHPIPRSRIDSSKFNLIK